MNDFALVSLIQHMSKIGKVVSAGNFILKSLYGYLSIKQQKRSRFLSASKRLYKLMCRLKCKKKKEDVRFMTRIFRRIFDDEQPYNMTFLLRILFS